MPKEKSAREQKNIHDGHRARLYDLAVNAGVENLSEIQIVELFLTYIFPRGDVNPLAHRLLDEFGSFADILDATEAELVAVLGVNGRSARKIGLVKEMFFAYTTCRMGPKQVLKNKADVLDVIESYLRFRTTENILLLALSPASKLIKVKRIDKGSLNSVSMDNIEFATFLASAKPAAFVVAHCHPYGSAMPSSADKQAVVEIQDICNSCGVRFIDSFILGDEGVYSMLENQLVRTYHDVAEIKTVFDNLKK